MNFYAKQHEFYCGIDLHAKRMYVCVVRHDGEIVLHRNLKTAPQELLKALEPFRGADLVIGVESTYNWYWLADLCLAELIPFVLGHALVMKAIHGGKTKNDKQDSLKIAMLGHRPKVGREAATFRKVTSIPRRRVLNAIWLDDAATSSGSAPNCKRISATRLRSTTCPRRQDSCDTSANLLSTHVFSAGTRQSQYWTDHRSCVHIANGFGLEVSAR